MDPKIVITILGQDRPGIIARITRVLFEQDCNVENVSQTILQSEFSGIFIVSIPETLAIDALYSRLIDQTEDLGLHVYIKDLKPAPPASPAGDPFVITTQGPDRKGLVAAVTAIIAEHGVNVTNLQAVFKGGNDPTRNIMIYEVCIPLETDRAKMTEQLTRKAAELGLHLSIQHRRIFETINRI
ncbi:MULTISPECIES: glycine cleavage system protein R [Desulfococcus]|jgi:glycine cleavage system transcriptional repressor|uniref:ACT domain-containing protein n=1 Tax=Desulfococcus multivorans DSM 2059 TaxID=1121405 RepID=S7U607_DESML|nr:ACT domain-containing protein [Desulfococcus multivorans]AOY59147.1 amino acid-binding ACT domain protein [Desulfococcus multivorans]AQV01379.1 amino acid-binding protein [Desulfococcus multivorans]EPR44956.1 ACT domain-containing protein [Desulfococcus multivorans DSM 2059]MDX9818197.1 ACT domain-containing protein [Desulfococcus multivorans]SJZ84381.1 glycine cleavage system transcriptional repressor [Desulfococcus multivorans DSM 2059]